MDLAFFSLVLFGFIKTFICVDSECQTACAPQWTLLQEAPKTLIVYRKLGDFVTFRCPALGNPRPNITWTKDEAMIHSSNANISLQEFNIFIPRIFSSESGIYTCTLFNRLGTLQRHFKLIVEGNKSHRQQEEMRSPSNVTVTEGQSAIFTCEFTTELHKRTTVKWVKENREKSLPHCSQCVPKRLEIKHELNDGTNELRLTGLNVMDSGEYTCIIIAPNVTLERSAWLRVTPNIEDFEPRVSGVVSNTRTRKTTVGHGLDTYFKGVGISLAAMVGLVVLGFLIVGVTTIFRALCKLDKRQERPYD